MTITHKDTKTMILKTLNGVGDLKGQVLLSLWGLVFHICPRRVSLMSSWLSVWVSCIHTAQGQLERHLSDEGSFAPNQSMSLCCINLRSFSTAFQISSENLCLAHRPVYVASCIFLFLLPPQQPFSFP